MSIFWQSQPLILTPNPNRLPSPQTITSDTYWGHQLISKPTWDEYTAKCVKSARPNYKDCALLQIQINQEVGDLNPYALDYPVCVEDSASAASSSKKSTKGRAQRMWVQNAQLEAALGGRAEVQKLQAQGLLAAGADAYEPCADDYEVRRLLLSLSLLLCATSNPTSTPPLSRSLPTT